MSFAEYFGTQDSLHHLYLLEGATQATPTELASFLKETRETDDAHIQVFTYSTLGVEDAAGIRRAHNETSHDGSAQYFIVSAISVTPEAQQSLLKTFEEPRAQTHFFLLMPEMTSLLPTVRSRAQYVKLQEMHHEYIKEADQFIKASFDQRLSFVADFIKQHEDEDDSGLLRLHASQFIVALLEVLHKDPKNLITKKQFFNDALTMRTYLDTRGASVKMILEHMAIAL